ncbi:MAG: cytidine deaminase [Thermoplasmatota archaeon]
MRLTRFSRELLMAAARRAASSAHSPYSGVRVGAAVLTGRDRVFTGCNVENASYGLTVCAERVAIQCAVAAGEREVLAVAVSSPDAKGIAPCGACRQVMVEFAGPEGLVVVMEGERGLRAVPLDRLLPEAFRRSISKHRPL